MQLTAITCKNPDTFGFNFLTLKNEFAVAAPTMVCDSYLQMNVPGSFCDLG